MEAYIRFVLKRPKLILLCFTVITIYLTLGIFKLEFDTSIDAFLPKKDPDYILYNHIKKIYGDSDVFVIFAVGGNDFWNPTHFKNMAQLVTDIKEYQDFNLEKENGRLNKLSETLRNTPVSIQSLDVLFDHDDSFKRLLNRKISKLYGDIESIDQQKVAPLLRAVKASIDLKQQQTIKDIISPFTTKDIIGFNDSLEAVPIIDQTEDGNWKIPQTKDDYKALVNKLTRNPAFENGIFARDPETKAISDFGFIIRFDNNENHDDIARELLEIGYHRTDMKIITQGQPLVYIWINKYMQSDLMKLIPLVMLVCLIIFYINFRSWRGVFWAFLSLNMANVWIIGLMGHLGFKMTTVGVSLPVLMIAVGSSYAIHILNQYYADLNWILEHNQMEGLLKSMSHISLTVLLAGGTTMVAFLTLAPHQLSAIREWGIFSGIGVFFAVLISASIIPAGLILTPEKTNPFAKKQPNTKRNLFIDQIIKWTTVGSIKHYKIVLFSVSILIGISIIGIFNLKVETEFLQYFKEDNQIRTTAQEIGEKFGGHWGFNIIIDSGEVDGIKSSDFLNKVNQIRSWLIAEENADLSIGRTDGFSDYIMTMHMAMNDDNPAFFKIPENNMDILDYLEILSGEDENADGRLDYFEPYIDEDFQRINLLARISSKNGQLVGTSDLKRIFKKISLYLDENLPAPYSYQITGHPKMIMKCAKYVVNGQIQSLLLSFVIIAGVVLILLRNFMAGLLSLIPMSVAVIINYGIMGWFDIKLDIATSIIAAITIGIGVDDTIHFINTFRFYQKKGYTLDQTIEKTLMVAGKAIIYTSLVLICGFSVLTISTFKPLILFGFLMGVTMVATTIGALLVLPAAIKAMNFSLLTADESVLKKNMAVTETFQWEN